ncbi:MAG: PaaI family thioesterase [Phycisphaerae bacterium]|nr:PaaI family thioesterase [Phycisphaerae bacterium]
MGLQFEQQPDGSVVACFACNANYQSYPDRLHGGVVSMLLDAAMTNCMFAHHIQAVTARLNIRFRHPVKLGVEATIRARLVDQSPPLYVLRAELLQDGRPCALADGKFYAEGHTASLQEEP